jgi:hypothetical protein
MTLFSTIRAVGPSPLPALEARLADAYRLRSELAAEH